MPSRKTTTSALWDVTYAFRRVNLVYGALRLAGCALPLIASAAFGAENLLELQQVALQRDPEYRTAQFAHDVQFEQHAQAYGALMPSVSFEANSMGNRTRPRGPSAVPEKPHIDFNSHRWEVSVTQPLLRGDLMIGLGQANIRVRAAEAELAAARQDLLVRLAEAYFGVLRAVDSLNLARAETKALAKQLDSVKMRLEFGLVAITDVNEAQAGYDSARARVLDAENAVRTARDQLKTITGESPARLAPLGERLPLAAPEPADAEKWAQTALKQNLKLQASALNADSAREEIRKTEAGHMPTLELVARTNMEEANGGSAGPSDIANSSIGLQLSLPIFRGNTVLSRTRESRAQYGQAVERLERERRASERDAREAYFGVKTNLDKIHVLEQAVRSHQSAVDAVKLGYQLNHRTSIDLVNAQRELFRARNELVSARYDYVVNSLKLKRAAGTLADEDTRLVNGWLDASKRIQVRPENIAGLPLPASLQFVEQDTPAPVLRRGNTGLQLKLQTTLGARKPSAVLLSSSSH